MMNKRFLVVTSALLALTAGSSAWAQQFARPDGVQSTGTWTAVNAVSHAAAVNEDPFDNADYINSGIGNNSEIIFTLSDISDPGAGNYANTHIIRYRCQSTLEPGAKGGKGEGKNPAWSISILSILIGSCPWFWIFICQRIKGCSLGMANVILYANSFLLGSI